METREVRNDRAAQSQSREALWDSGNMKGLRQHQCHQPGREAGGIGSLKIINPLLSLAVYTASLSVWIGASTPIGLDI